MDKLAAFTETGLESIPDSMRWTDTLLKALRKRNVNLCYVLVWRNDMNSPTHYYAPHPGHAIVPDFIRFYEDPYTDEEVFFVTSGWQYSSKFGLHKS